MNNPPNYKDHAEWWRNEALILRDKLKRAKKRRRKAEKEARAAKGQHTVVAREMDARESEYDEARERAGQLRDRVAALESDLRAREQELQDLRAEENTALRKENSTLVGQVEIRNKSQADGDEKHATELGQAKADALKWHRAFLKEQDRTASLSEQLRKSQKDRSRLERVHEEQEKAIASLQDAIGKAGNSEDSTPPDETGRVQP
jgi:chromosome segregation ATPase